MIRLLSFLLVIGLAACGADDEGTSTNCNSTVDQAQVLSRYSDLIDSRASAVIDEAVVLNNTALSYLAAPTENELSSLRAAFLETSYAWILVEPFAFGPDGSLLTIEHVNAFPVDEDAVDALLTSGSFDESLPPNFDRGLPALDYLLFNGSFSDVNQRLSASTALRELIAELTTAILNQMNLLRATWDDAESSFTASTGTSAGSGLSELINGLSRHFENTRRDRIGTPFGVNTLGFPNPQTVEAPYSETSIERLQLAINASSSAFFATDQTSTQSLPSLADYIEGLPTSDAKTLVDDIENQYAAMTAALARVDGPLQAAVEEDVDDMQEAYNQISRQVVNLKTDIPAVACVSITYVDNPSDSD